MKDFHKKNNDVVIKDSTSEATYKSYIASKPNFFNKNFRFISNIVSFMLGFYIMFTTILFLIVHFNNGTMFKSKSVLLEYDALLYSNLIMNLLFGVIIITNYIGFKTESLTTYLLIDAITFSLYFFYVQGISTKDFFLFEFLQLLKLSLMGLSIVLLFYLVYYYISNICHLRAFLGNNFSFEDIYHEISLRTDMIKFAYNDFIIRCKLHKVFPGLLYKRDSFYYLTIKNNKYQQNKRLIEETESLHVPSEIDEKQKLMSKSSGYSKNAYLSTMGEY